MWVFHWSRPCNRLYDSRVSYESCRKKAQKTIVGKEIPDKTVDFLIERKEYTDKN